MISSGAGRHNEIPGFGGLEREIVIDNIDKELPVINSLVTSNEGYINEDIKLIGKAIDTLSGIEAYQFSKEGSLTATSGGWTPVENTKEEIEKEYSIQENGTYYFYVKDAAENVTKKEIVINNIDKIKPTAQIEPNGGTYVIPVGSREIEITAKITASDEGTSNLKVLKYQISDSEEMPSEEDENWKDFRNGENITEKRGGGKYYLYTKIIDGAGNRAEEIKKSEAYIVNYQVKYDANKGEGAPEDQEKVHNENLTLTTKLPTRVGHTFKGWATSSEATEVEYTVGGEYSKNEAVVLYAVWEINDYEVTYNFSENGGTSATKETDTITYMEQIDLTPTAEKAGYEFVGWNTNKDATEGLTELKMGPEDVTLYAIYRKQITATFNYYNGTQAAVKTSTGYMYNKLTTGQIVTPTIENVVKDSVTYIPRGWSTANTANATINVVGGNSVTVSEGATYYASYTQTITATFYYNANKTATSSAARYMNYQGTYIQSNIAIPTAVTTTAGPASTSYHHVGTSKTGGAVTPTTGTLTYYAVYTKTVTATKYVYNNSSSTATGTAYGYYDGTTTNASIGLGTTTLSGYTFRGWSTSNAANAGITIAANGTASIINNTTYYASYTQTVTATFYYHANKTATSSATRYMNYAGTYIHANISLPSAVSSSAGPSSTTFSHVATSKTGAAVSPTTATLTYYTVYRKTVTANKFIYKNRSTKSTGAAYGYYDGTTAGATINLGTAPANGYTFRGWRTSIVPTGTINVSPNGNVTIVNDTNYYAAYSYTVYLYYNLNGGSGSISATSGWREDAGKYQCEVSNPVSSKSSLPVRLAVIEE